MRRYFPIMVNERLIIDGRVPIRRTVTAHVRHCCNLVSAAVLELSKRTSNGLELRRPLQILVMRCRALIPPRLRRKAPSVGYAAIFPQGRWRNLRPPIKSPLTRTGAKASLSVWEAMAFEPIFPLWEYVLTGRRVASRRSL